MNKRQRLLRSQVSGTLLLAWSGLTYAQSVSNEACPTQACLSDVTVTAQRYGQKSLNTPISLTVQTGKSLEEKQTSTLSDLAFSSPGVSFYEEGPGKSSFNIRGISSAVGSSTVSIYQDEIALTSFNTFQINPDLYDLDRTEILRGPQGTLFGEGSMGGTIRLITNKPNPTRFSYKLRASAYEPYRPNTGQVMNGGWRGDIALNVPIVADRLAVRVTSSRLDDGGFIRQPDLNRNAANSSERRLDRVNGLLIISDSTFLDASVSTYTTRYGALNRANEKFEQPGKTDTNSFDDLSAGSLKLSTSLNSADIELIATRYLRNFDTRQEGKADLKRFFGGDPATSAFVDSSVDAVPIIDRGRNEKTALEARSVWDVSSRLKLTSGIFTERNNGLYSPLWQTRFANGMSDTQFLQVLSQFTGGGTFPNAALLDAKYDNRSTTRAVYINGDYRLTSRIKLGAGVRHNRQELESTTRGFYFGLPITGDISETFVTNNPRTYVSIDLPKRWVNDGILYFSAAKGFRAGGANNRVDNALISQSDPIPSTYRPDRLWTYELGTKYSTLNGRVVPQIAIYYNDWRDVQSFTTSQSGLVPFITNVGDASGYGLDMLMDFKVTTSLTLSAGYAFNDMKFTTSTQQKNRGAPMDYNPRHSFSLSAAYETALSAGWRNRSRLDFSFRDRTFLTPTAGDTRESDTVRLLNGRIGFFRSTSSASQVELALFARNLTNYKGRLDPNFSFSSDATLTPARVRPRTLGLELQISN
jgi:iron complex outermembrane recepter protein